MLDDVRYAVRGFRRTPGFTFGALLTLALGIGASTAIFSVVDRILFRPLPYPAPERLVSVGLFAPAADTNEFLPVSSYLRIRDRQSVFSGMAAFAFTSDCDLTQETPIRARCTRVDADFLPTFGVAPLTGRFFANEQDSSAILTFPFWMSRFGGDRAVIGRPIRIDGQTFTIAGILPRDFELFNLSPTDILLPAGLAPDQQGRVVRAFARLQPGVSIQQAQAALEPLFGQARLDFPPELRSGLRLVVRGLRDRQIWPVRTASWTLFAAVLLVLLIACGNVENLLLARARGRRREQAIRVALGASRARLARQALTESLLLSSAGAIAGVALAAALLRFFIWIAPGGITRLNQAAIDPRVLLFALAVSIAGGIVLGLIPAFGRPDPEALAGGRSVAGFRGIARDGWIAAQIAASLVLLSGAGLLLRTLWSIENLPLGFDSARTLTARFVLSRRYTPERELAFFEGLEERLRRLPGPAAIASSVPPFGGVQSTPFSALNVEGRAPLPEGAGGAVAWRYVTPGYFSALAIPIRHGRTFTEADRAPEASSVVLSDSLARRLFGNDNPVGRRIFRTREGWHTVIGVVADVRNNGLQAAQLAEYYAVRKHARDELFGDGSGWRGATIVARGPVDPGAVRAAVAELDPTLPVTFQTMRERVAELTERPRFNALLLAGFAACGLGLAAIGIYGLVAFLVTQRTREVGVRMAMGATPAAIARQFLWNAGRWTIAGIALGGIVSFPATRWLGATLDVASFAPAAALLAVVALAAACVPALRAARIDPAQCLRRD